MVRHKTRWFLVELKVLEDPKNNDGDSCTGWVTKQRKRGRGKTALDTTTIKAISNIDFPTKKDFTIRLRRTIDRRYGLVGESISPDVQVRFYDANTQTTLIRVPRHHCDKVRAALALLLTRKKMAALGERGNGGGAFKTADVAALVVSIHGSARTAKIATFQKLRDIYRTRLTELHPRLKNADGSTKQLKHEQKALCQALHERLTLVQNID